MALKNGRPVVKSVGAEDPALPLSSLSQSADVIAEGTIGLSRTYFSDDGTLIYIDVQFNPVRVIQDRSAFQAAPSAPSDPIVIRQIGGTLEPDGIPITVANEGADPLETGDSVFVSLKRVPGEARYNLISDRWGVFRSAGGTVVPKVPSDVNRSYVGMSASDFAAEIGRYLKQRRQH